MYGKFTQTSSTTVRELLYWSYANLAMASAAVANGATTYGAIHYSIRTKFHKGFLDGRYKLGPLSDDERLKMTLPQVCAYCGGNDRLSIDHLVPKKMGGEDLGENSVWACRRCNSSKGSTDLLEWHVRCGKFPSLYVIRRYLKLFQKYCDENGLLDTPLENVGPIPFSIRSVPIKYPVPSTLQLWVRAEEEFERQAAPLEEKPVDS